MKLKVQVVLFVCTAVALGYYYSPVCSQTVPPENRVVISPLALGGMLQGLLSMQIRPESGFYEEKYKEIFKDDGTEPVRYESLLHLSDKDLTELTEHFEPEEILSNDGKLLKEANLGISPNPCFDSDRLTQNRLLGLVCSMKIIRVTLSYNNSSDNPVTHRTGRTHHQWLDPIVIMDRSHEGVPRNERTDVIAKRRVGSYQPESTDIQNSLQPNYNNR
ncbi:uncharacterized protein NPIL_429681 [Nephila pilipes]|uniref:Uncharacterized protein n=1 Tax=Nephila pilipes TaxID=299642 RepID=A0A8X6Q7E8_NEPPI|nr:uncharacterized protein NPIL_429681 [Nephila pilipes]